MEKGPVAEGQKALTSIFRNAFGHQKEKLMKVLNVPQGSVVFAAKRLKQLPPLKSHGERISKSETDPSLGKAVP